MTRHAAFPDVSVDARREPLFRRRFTLILSLADAEYR